MALLFILIHESYCVGHLLFPCLFGPSGISHPSSGRGAWFAFGEPTLPFLRPWGSCEADHTAWVEERITFRAFHLSGHQSIQDTGMPQVSPVRVTFRTSAWKNNALFQPVKDKPGEMLLRMKSTQNKAERRREKHPWRQHPSIQLWPEIINSWTFQLHKSINSPFLLKPVWVGILCISKDVVLYTS